MYVQSVEGGMVGMKSAAEEGIMDFWRAIQSHDFISVNQFLEFTDRLWKLLDKCEDLRRSRDNWKNKFETLRLATKNS